MMQAEPSELERRYRRLLRAFPRGYRQHRGEEMLATLLEGAGPGQTRPTAADIADLMQAALRERLGLHAAPDLQAALRLVGPFCLAVAAGFAVSSWSVNPASPMFALVAGVWLMAVLAAVMLPRLTAAAIAVAWTVTGGVIVSTLGSADQGVIALGLDEADLSRLHPYAFAVVAICGLIALISSLTVAWRLSRFVRAGLAVTVTAAIGLSVLVGRLGHGDTPWAPLVVRYPEWMTAVSLVPFALLAAGLVAVIWRRSTMLLWAGLLLLVPYPAMVPWTMRPLDIGFLQTVPLYRLWAPGASLLVPFEAGVLALGEGRLVGCTVLGATAALAVFLADVNRRAPRPRDGRSALSALSGVALGMLGGVCLYVAAYAGYQRLIGVRSPTTSFYPLQAVAASGGIGPLTPAVVLPVGLTVVVALATPLLPRWLRAPVVLATTVWLLNAPARGPIIPFSRFGFVDVIDAPSPGSVDVFRACVVLLALVALADLRVRWRTVAAPMAATLAVCAWLAWLNPYNGSTDATMWQLSVLYCLSAAVLVLALWWALVVIVRADQGWVGGLLAFTAGLMWFALQLWWIVTDHTELELSLASVIPAVLAGRILFRARLRARGTA
jgi:hypothetical protein